MHILDSPPHYFYFSGNANAFAVQPACVDKKDGPLSGLFAASCQVQKNFADAVNSTVTTLTPAWQGSALDSARKAGGNIYRPPPAGKGGGTPKSAKCGGCDAGNIGCELGKLSCEFTGALGDATGSTFDFFGKYMPYFLAGGAIIIAVLLIKR